MLFQVRLLLFIVFFTCRVACQEDWGDPPLSDGDTDGIKVDGQAGDKLWIISVPEEIKDSDGRGIKINYSGTAKLSLKVPNRISIELFEDGSDHFLVFKNTPDYDTDSTLDDLIISTDDGSEGLTVHLNLVNIDDNHPEATLDTSECTIKENELETNNPCLITINDVDKCAKNINFVITGQEDGDLFDFQPVGNANFDDYPNCLNQDNSDKSSQYQLIVKTPLDFEKMRSYFLTINYNDGNENPGSPALQMVVKVEDVRDEPPTWVTIISAKTVNEETEDSFSVKAIDQDVTFNEKIIYTLEVTDDGISEEERKCFSIDRESGKVSIGKIQRDLWQKNSYSLFLTAAEEIDPDSEINTTVVVQVLDSINKMFEYTISGTTGKDFPPIEIDENSVVKFEYEVTVTDPDEGDAGTFEATINHDKFMVLPSRGIKQATFVIQGRAPLDFEDPDERELNFKLVIQEIKDSSHKVELPINIIVKNLNDNAPQFLNVESDGKIHAQVAENFKGGVFTTIQATDADGDLNEITYEMVDYSGLSINPKTGEISAEAGVFDFEQQSVVMIQVTASDGELPSYVALKIDVEDINDTPPTIRVDTSGTLEVAEDVEPPGPVDVVIKTSDPDGSAELEVAIDWETTTGTKNNQLVDKEKFRGWFDVSMTLTRKANADIHITVAKQLRWDVIDTIRLNITVKDKKTEINADTSFTVVSIVINDVNNNPPVFGEKCGANPSVLSMDENAPENLNVGSVLATDADGPGFNTVIYSLENKDEKRIKIDPSRGLISTGSEPVDYESEQTISVVIVATDDTKEKLSSTCSILVQINDVNDNAPEGIPEPPTVQIPEDTGSNFFISHVTGTDSDATPEFSKIIYDLNTFSDYFSIIDTDDGVDVTVNFKDDKTFFDYDNGGTKKYELSVILTDYPDDPTGGRLQKSSKTAIVVEITDVNDNEPQLNAPSEKDCFFLVTELTQANAPLTGVSKLEATDSDSGVNSWISYEIREVECVADTMQTCPADKDNLFAVSGNSDTPAQNVKADVVSKNVLTDKYGQYLVTVVANDHGEPPLSSQPAKYRFCITDTNNNPPVIEYPEKISIYQDDKGALIDESTGAELTPIVATDKDFEDNAKIVFTVDSDDVFGVQNQGSNQARLFLQGGVDLTQIKETVLTISACDSPKIDEPLCDHKQLTIKSHNVNQVEPEFEVNFADTLLMENDTSVVYEFTAATDSNNDGNDPNDPNSVTEPIYYFIISTEPEDGVDYFSLIKEETRVTLKKALDAFVCDNYLVTIQATNKPAKPLPTPDSKSTLTVNITVQDINDKFPIFERDQYTISMSSGDEGRNLVTLRATDPDRYDTVTYDIDLSSLDTSHLDTPVSSNDMFSIEKTTGAIKIVNYPTQATRGFVTFTASATDGKHDTPIPVTVYVVTEKYLMPFQFANTEAQLVAYLNEVINQLSEVFRATCIAGRTSSDSQYATLLVHFEDDQNIPIEPKDLATVSNNVTAMADLKTYLKDNFDLVLIKVGTDAVKNDTPEVVNTALIAVSAVLAALLLASVIFFFIKHRSLKNHVDRLTKASTDIPIETKDTVLPNTNQNMGIGSNPIYNTEVVAELDNISIQSGDSGLIGIEDNPEFEQFYQKLKERALSSGQTTDDMLREDPQLRALQMTNDIDMSY